MVPKDPRESFASLNGEEQVNSTIQPTLLAGEAKNTQQKHPQKESFQGRIVNLPGETKKKRIAALHRS